MLTNNGRGGFTLASSPAVGLDPGMVVAADVNGDDWVDLISENENSESLTVLTNDGRGGFALAATIGGLDAPISVAAADLNGDGRVDLIGGVDDNTLTVLTNDGRGGFARALTVSVGCGPGSIAVADINGDGSLDLATANVCANTLTVLSNFPHWTKLSNWISGSYSGRFVGDGSGLRNVSADALIGDIADHSLSPNVALLNANQTFTGANRFTSATMLTHAGNNVVGTFTGNGAGLTNLVLTDGSVTTAKIADGTITDGDLSSNAQISANKIVGGDLMATRLKVGASHVLNATVRFYRGWRKPHH